MTCQTKVCCPACLHNSKIAERVSRHCHRTRLRTVTGGSVYFAGRRPRRRRRRRSPVGAGALSLNFKRTPPNTAGATSVLEIAPHLEHVCVCVRTFADRNVCVHVRISVGKKTHQEFALKALCRGTVNGKKNEAHAPRRVGGRMGMSNATRRRDMPRCRWW